MDAIQDASDRLSPFTYLKYVSSWKKPPSRAEHLEQTHPALYYLRTATRYAIRNIQTTDVKQGLAVWYFYNMGYVFKTPDTCFGIDLHFRDAEQLADDLDFLLITHQHRDHYSTAMLDAMLNVGKPVITRWYPGSILVKQPGEFTFGHVRVKVDIGDHRHYLHLPRFGVNNTLMFQIDCGETARHCTIYHSGDGGYYPKMTPDKPVDIFIAHVHLFFMSLEKAIHHVQPRITFVSHVLELSHSSTFPFPMRWSFEHAFKRVEHVNDTETLILTWGERWLLPGTVLETNESNLKVYEKT